MYTTHRHYLVAYENTYLHLDYFIMKSIKIYAKSIGNMQLHGKWLRIGVHKALCQYSKLSYQKIEKVYYLLSYDKKYIFLINPLVASQSMRSGLNANSIEEGYDLFFRSHEIVEFPKDEFYDFHRFCIVRNPWERVLSCFHKKVTNANTSLKLLLISRHPEIRLDMRFEEFVDFLCGPNGVDEKSDSHWMSQHSLLSDPLNNPLWSHFYKLEEFSGSMYDAVHAAGINSFKIPRIGSSEQMAVKRKKNNFRTYYNDETWNKIASRYAEDIEIFGYKDMV